MKRIIGLGVGGLLALVAGLVLPHLPDSALRYSSDGNWLRVFGRTPLSYGTSTFQRAAAFCGHATHPIGDIAVTPAIVAQYRSLLRSCATAHDVMNLGAWLVVLGAAALAAAGVVLLLRLIRRRPALDMHAV